MKRIIKWAKDLFKSKERIDEVGWEEREDIDTSVKNSISMLEAYQKYKRKNGNSG